MHSPRPPTKCPTPRAGEVNTLLAALARPRRSVASAAMAVFYRTGGVVATGGALLAAARLYG